MTVDPRRPPNLRRLEGQQNPEIWADELLRTHNPEDLDVNILKDWFERAMATVYQIGYAAGESDAYQEQAWYELGDDL